jgi:hypothetical protein
MAGLVPAIHDFLRSIVSTWEAPCICGTWMAGSGPAMTMSVGIIEAFICGRTLSTLPA